jgi:murein DD-endopeptidase MepM/ murein hydrolase activator NlpD
MDPKDLPKSIPSRISYTTAPFKTTPDVPVIGPPLEGNGWVALDSLDTVKGDHRGAISPVNGGLFISQRYAIDWVRLDENGHYLHGDPTDVRCYTGYGDPILAVADGVVVETLNNLENATPPKSPDPSTITLQNALGNHVILDIGGGYYAFYAHMQKGSVTVKPGDRVRRGQVLGRVGNSGNTASPHLHFHIMNGPTVYGSDGLPYAMDHFELAGQIPAEEFGDFTVPFLEKDFNPWRSGPPMSRRKQYPLNYTIINFPPMSSVRSSH